ncbi:MAG: NAD-dependent epimerase/dehydratase family protein [Phocaeicola sp.]
MSKQIIITGATGYIGKTILELALSKGYEVVCLVNPNSTRKDYITKSPKVRILECSMDEYKNLDRATLPGEYEHFFHLAWANTTGIERDNAYSQIRNIEYTIDALYLAHKVGCKSFIGAGSQAEFGVVETGINLNSTTPCYPTSGYGIAKLAAGKLCNLTSSQLGIKFNWIRILSIYGVGDNKNSLISYVTNELKADNSPSLTKCEQIWDYLNVNDAASAFWSVAKKGIAGKTYVLGSGVGKPLKEYIDEIYTLCEATCEVGFGNKNYYPHQPMYLVADISELITDTEWKPTVTFKEGIKQMINKE